MKNTVKALCLFSLAALVGCGQQRGTLAPDQTANQQDAGIIGGKAAVAGSVVANTTVGLYDVSIGATCTASILSSKFLLTAAHCVNGSKAASLRVIFGLKISSKGTVVRKVSGFRFHKKWLTAVSSDQRDLGDIAIVKFDGGLPAGYRPAKLLSDASLIQNDAEVLLAGFGHNNGIAKEGSGILRYVVVKIQDAKFSPTEVMLDQTKGKGACQGDSGGPAYLLDKKGNMVLFGVTSRGVNDPLDTCGEGAVYTNALAHIAWMKAAVASLNAPKSLLISDGAFETEVGVASSN